MPDLKTLLTPDVSRNPALLTAAQALRAALFSIPVITIFWQEQIGGIELVMKLLGVAAGAATLLTWLLFARAHSHRSLELWK